MVAPAGGVVEVDLSALPAGSYSVRLGSDVPVVASWSRTQQRPGGPAEGLTGVPVDRAWVQALPTGSPWRPVVVLPLAGLLAEPGGLEGTTLGLLAAGDEGGRARVAVLDGDGQELVSRPVDLPSGQAPLGLALSGVLEGLDPAQAASLAVSSAAGVHLGVDLVLADPDGDLVAGTSVPGPQDATTSVRLVRQGPGGGSGA